MSHIDYKLKDEEYIWVNFKDVLKRFKDVEHAHREFIHKSVHIGQGILEQINNY